MSEEAKPPEDNYERFQKFGDVFIHAGIVNLVSAEKVYDGVHQGGKEASSAKEDKPTPKAYDLPTIDDLEIPSKNVSTGIEKTFDWLKKLSAEDFVLAFAVTLLNLGEQNLVTNFYQYLLDDKFAHELSDDKTLQYDASRNNKKVSALPPKRKRQAIDIFGTGLNERLKLIGAQFDERIFNLGDETYRVRIIRFTDSSRVVDLWEIWRSEYPTRLNDIREEIKFLAEFGDFHTRAIAARALGEMYKNSLPSGILDFIENYASARDTQIRYNVGYILQEVLANDQYHNSEVFGLLSRWANSEDWRKRWTAAASISRLFKYDIELSSGILTDIVKKSEQVSRDNQDILELNPLNMIWHSASVMTMRGHILKILDLLGSWIENEHSKQKALSDIARQLFLDILQNYFDLRSITIMRTTEKNKPTSDLVSQSRDETQVTSETSGKTTSGNDQVSEAAKEDTNSEDKVTNSGNNPEQRKGNPSSTSPSQKDADSVGQNGNQEETNEPEESEQLIEDLTAKIDKEAVDKINITLWRKLADEFQQSNSHRGGHYTHVVVYLLSLSLSQSKSYSRFNPLFKPPFRQAPNKAALELIREWINLSKENKFSFIQDPLYVVLMECYVNPKFLTLRDERLKEYLERWFNNPDHDLYRDAFLEQVLSAMNIVKNSLVTD